MLGSVNASDTISTGWNLDIDLFAPGSNQSENLAFITSILADLAAKRALGFAVTLNDFWGRILSYKFLPGTTPRNYLDPISSLHGKDIDFSGAKNL